MSFGEMHRRVEMRAAMLGRTEAIGEIKEAALRQALVQLFQFEAGRRCRPVDGVGVEGMAEIDDLRGSQIEALSKGWTRRRCTKQRCES